MIDSRGSTWTSLPRRPVRPCRKLPVRAHSVDRRAPGLEHGAAEREDDSRRRRCRRRARPGDPGRAAGRARRRTRRAPASRRWASRRRPGNAGPAGSRGAASRRAEGRATRAAPVSRSGVSRAAISSSARSHETRSEGGSAPAVRPGEEARESVGMVEALESRLSAGTEAAAVDRMERVAVDLDDPLADPPDAQPAASGAEIAHGQDETLRPARRVDGQVRGMEKVTQRPSRRHAHRSPRGGTDRESQKPPPADVDVALHQTHPQRFIGDMSCNPPTHPCVR